MRSTSVAEIDDFIMKDERFRHGEHANRATAVL